MNQYNEDVVSSVDRDFIIQDLWNRDSELELFKKFYEEEFKSEQEGPCVSVDYTDVNHRPSIKLINHPENIRVPVSHKSDFNMDKFLEW